MLRRRITSLFSSASAPTGEEWDNVIEVYSKLGTYKAFITLIDPEGKKSKIEREVWRIEVAPGEYSDAIEVDHGSQYVKFTSVDNLILCMLKGTTLSISS